MARKSRDDDLLLEDELTAAFLGEEDNTPMTAMPEVEEDMVMDEAPVQEDWFRRSRHSKKSTTEIRLIQRRASLIYSQSRSCFPESFYRHNTWKVQLL